MRRSGSVAITWPRPRRAGSGPADPGAGLGGRPGRRDRHRGRGRHVRPGRRGFAAPEPPVNTAEVERGELSDVVSLDGILTYGARLDGSPYAVLNQARG